MSEEDELDHQVRRATGAERKPWWFTALGLVVVVLSALAAERASDAAGARPQVSPLFGLAAGVLFGVTVLGHTAGRYRDARTGQYETFWSRRGREARVWCALAGGLLISIGVVVDRLVAGR